jgi:hypothetical protein
LDLQDPRENFLVHTVNENAAWLPWDPNMPCLPDAPLRRRRLMIAPAAVGCRWKSASPVALRDNPIHDRLEPRLIKGMPAMRADVRQLFTTVGLLERVTNRIDHFGRVITGGVAVG